MLALIETKTETRINIDLETAAKWFAALSDDEQCRFFVAVTKIADEWPGDQGSQWWRVGSHIRNCECSSDLARQMIREMHAGLERGTH